MPSSAKETSHAKDACLGAAVDIGDNGRMQQSRRPKAIIERQGDGYVALCTELDIGSPGDTVERARANPIEALTLFLEIGDPSEIDQRPHSKRLPATVVFEAELRYPSSCSWHANALRELTQGIQSGQSRLESVLLSSPEQHGDIVPKRRTNSFGELSGQSVRNGSVDFLLSHCAVER